MYVDVPRLVSDVAQQPFDLEVQPVDFPDPLQQFDGGVPVAFDETNLCLEE
jgi:hypothetical protein